MRTSNKVILSVLIGFFIAVLCMILLLRSSNLADMSSSAFSAYAKIFGNGNVATQNYNFPKDKFNVSAVLCGSINDLPK